MPAKTDEKAAEKAEPAAKATIWLTHDGDPGDLLSIGESVYPVSEGMVEVAPEHLEAALQAGFKPA